MHKTAPNRSRPFLGQKLRDTLVPIGTLRRSDLIDRFNGVASLLCLNRRGKLIGPTLTEIVRPPDIPFVFYKPLECMQPGDVMVVDGVTDTREPDLSISFVTSMEAGECGGVRIVGACAVF